MYLHIFDEQNNNVKIRNRAIVNRMYVESCFPGACVKPMGLSTRKSLIHADQLSQLSEDTEDLWKVRLFAAGLGPGKRKIIQYSLCLEVGEWVQVAFPNMVAIGGVTLQGR